jgi:hypothetical protein
MHGNENHSLCPERRRAEVKRHPVRIKETIATVIAEERYLKTAEDEILRQRSALEEFIGRDPFFQLTFEPYNCPRDAPGIVKRMCEASENAGVGPMAAVAGAIAECAVEAMVGAGAEHAIVDNGGDIALYLDSPVTLGIFAGESGIKDVGFRVEPTGDIIGICTSSGTIGPSISLGNADAATVVSKNVALADAAATALGNAIKTDDGKRIDDAMNRFGMDGIDGILVITRSHIGIRGSLPQIIKSRVDYDLITKG